MAVKKNARREIAASLKKAAGNCWEDSGNCWDGKTAPQFPIDAAKNLLGSRTKSAEELFCCKEGLLSVKRGRNLFHCIRCIDVMTINVTDRTIFIARRVFKQVVNACPDLIQHFIC